MTSSSNFEPNMEPNQLCVRNLQILICTYYIIGSSKLNLYLSLKLTTYNAKSTSLNKEFLIFGLELAPQVIDPFSSPKSL